MIHAPSRPRRRPGAVLMELAVMLPLVILLLFGIWEVGRMIEVQQLLSNAAREGGRQASTGKRSVTEIQQTVVNYLARNGITITESAVTVANLTNSSRDDPRAGSPSPPYALQMDRFRITVSVPVDSIRWILLDRITSVATLTASADWCSMNDVPLTVSTSIPAAPQ